MSRNFTLVPTLQRGNAYGKKPQSPPCAGINNLRSKATSLFDIGKK